MIQHDYITQFWACLESLPWPDSDVKLCRHLPHVAYVEYASTVSGYVVNWNWCGKHTSGERDGGMVYGSGFAT